MIEPGLAQATGGELTLTDDESFDLPGIVDTLENPDRVNAEASRDRLNLAGDAKCLAAAADAAESIQAKNSIERMLAHELAGAHTAAMKLLERGHQWLDFETVVNTEEPTGHVHYRTDRLRGRDVNIEGTRCFNAAARLIDAFQKGCIALQKRRTGGH